MSKARKEMRLSSSRSRREGEGRKREECRKIQKTVKANSTYDCLPTVQVSKFLQSEETGAVAVVPKDEGRGSVDGDGARQGVRVGRLA